MLATNYTNFYHAPVSLAQKNEPPSLSHASEASASLSIYKK
ncbi:MAG: hypothetical protein U5L45_07480 [Saprospiraceae bacterium]|nr:hypothetical protein [Saprospiraceae bacterium]